MGQLFNLMQAKMKKIGLIDATIVAGMDILVRSRGRIREQHIRTSDGGRRRGRTVERDPLTQQKGKCLFLLFLTIFLLLLPIFHWQNSSQHIYCVCQRILNIGGKNFEFLVDSGADHSVIRINELHCDVLKENLKH